MNGTNEVIVSAVEGYAAVLNWTSPSDDVDSSITLYWMEVTPLG